MAEELNLRQKLAIIRNYCDVVVKDKQGYGYTYSDITKILAKVKGLMKKHGVSLEPQIVPGSTNVIFQPISKTKTSKTGQVYEERSYEYLVTSDMVYNWIDDKTGETISVPWNMMGSQTDPSQAAGSGMSYGLRQFLVKYFQIAEVDSDVDGYRSKQKEAEMSEDLEIAKGLIAELHTQVMKLLANDESKGKDLKKFFEKYVKGGDYAKVKEPRLAGKMLEDFTNTYMKG